MGRLFKNVRDCKFKGEIHECVEGDGCVNISTDEVVIDHYGYLDEIKKINRNILYLLDLEQSCKDRTKVNFYLACSYYKLKDYNKALSYFDKWHKEYDNTTDLGLGISMFLLTLKEAKKYKEGYELGQKYYKQLQNNKLFLFYYADACSNYNKEQEAINLLTTLIALPNSHFVNMMDEGITTWKPFILLGNLYVSLNQYDKTLEYWEQGYKIYEAESILREIINVAETSQNFVYLMKYVPELMKKFPDNIVSQDKIRYGMYLFNTGAYKAAIDVLKKEAEGQHFIDQLVANLIAQGKHEIVQSLEI